MFSALLTLAPASLREGAAHTAAEQALSPPHTSSRPGGLVLTDSAHVAYLHFVSLSRSPQTVISLTFLAATIIYLVQFMLKMKLGPKNEAGVFPPPISMVFPQNNPSDLTPFSNYCLLPVPFSLTVWHDST